MDATEHMDKLMVIADDFQNDCTADDFEVATTAETIADFEDARNGWADTGRAEFGDAPIKHVMYTGVRLVRGERNREFIVCDCGDFRAVLTFK